MIVAKDLMKKPLTIQKSENVSDGISKLFQNKISRLLIENNGKISEIVTEKDIFYFSYSPRVKKIWIKFLSLRSQKIL